MKNLFISAEKWQIERRNPSVARMNPRSWHAAATGWASAARAGVKPTIWPRGAAADYLPMWAGDGDGSFLVVS